MFLQWFLWNDFRVNHYMGKPGGHRSCLRHWSSCKCYLSFDQAPYKGSTFYSNTVLFIFLYWFLRSRFQYSGSITSWERTLAKNNFKLYLREGSTIAFEVKQSICLYLSMREPSNPIYWLCSTEKLKFCQNWPDSLRQSSFCLHCKSKKGEKKLSN